MALDPGIVVIGGGLMDHEGTTPEFRERYLRTIRATATPYLWPGATRHHPDRPPPSWATCRRPSARRSWRCITPAVKPPNWQAMQALVEDFLQYLRHERGQSDNTAKTYAALLGKFTDWAAKQNLTGWGQVELKHLMAFLLHERSRPLADEPKASAKRLSGESVYLEIAALRAFYRFAENEKNPAAERRGKPVAAAPLEAFTEGVEQR